ncbi:hypothetical protein RBU60_06000 [Mesonia sp. MT50]|uniref:Uncharacterized protein n=1 Tax=Mesonia profundi TaxID=3070998 RepID=A0ABU1A089_9FLAO|nr:hypothetical protein [Mesonia profundi]MDQ7917122.1 hypothetical protein [Mesonia profundi]
MNKKDISKIIESTLISVASSFPVAASLATGWSEYKNHQQSLRIKDLLERYVKNLQKFKNQVDEEYLKKEEAKKLIEQTVEKGKDEVKSEKRKLLSDFLFFSSTKSLSKDNDKEMILYTIDKISLLQASLLLSITKYLSSGYGKENILMGSDYYYSKAKDEFCYQPEWYIVHSYTNKKQHEKSHIEACLDYLVSIGVIETASSRGFTTVWDKKGIKGYRPTKLGLKTLEYLGYGLDKLPDLDKSDKLWYLS